MKLASLTGPIASCWCSSGLNVVDYRTIMGYPQVVRVRAKVTACGPRTTSARRTMACSSSMVDDPGIEPRDAGNHDAVEIPVSYTHLRAHETPEHLVCRLLLE